MPQQGSRIQVHGTLVRVRVEPQISLRRFLSYRLESQALTVSLFESILRFYLQSFNIPSLRNLELDNQTTVLQSVIRNRLFGQEIGSCHSPTWVLAENAATSFRRSGSRVILEDRGQSRPKR